MMHIDECYKHVIREQPFPVGVDHARSRRRQISFPDGENFRLPISFQSLYQIYAKLLCADVQALTAEEHYRLPRVSLPLVSAA